MFRGRRSHYRNVNVNDALTNVDLYFRNDSRGDEEVVAIDLTRRTFPWKRCWPYFTRALLEHLRDMNVEHEREEDESGWLRSRRRCYLIDDLLFVLQVVYWRALNQIYTTVSVNLSFLLWLRYLLCLSWISNIPVSPTVWIVTYLGIFIVSPPLNIFHFLCFILIFKHLFFFSL